MDLSALILGALATSGMTQDDMVGDGTFLTESTLEELAMGHADFYLWKTDGTAVKFDKATARKVRDRLNAALAEPFDPALN